MPERKPIKLAGLLAPGFPVGQTPLITRDFNLETNTQGPLRIVRPQGPASDLPVTSFEELYPSTIPIEANERNLSPFNREFDFTQEPVNVKNTESINERAQRFLNQYFPGQNPGVVINPATNRAYGDELKIHDAMHDYANVGNTLRGEELITIAENIGATPLAAANVGLTKLTQQIDTLAASPDIEYDQALEKAYSNTRRGGPFLIQQRGAARGSSLFRDRNQVASFLSPPISKEEFNTMAQRGQEFYDQVHRNWDTFKNLSSGWSTEKTREGNEIRKAAEEEFFDNRYGPSRATTQRISGGYNKGGIPYGNPLALMNAPLVPTVDSKLWQESLNKILASGSSVLTDTIQKEQQAYMKPELIAAREAPKEWDKKSETLRNVYDDFVLEGKLPQSSEMQRDLRVYNALVEAQESGKKSFRGRTIREMIEDTIGERPDSPLYKQYREVTPVSIGVQSFGEIYKRPEDKNFFKEINEESVKKIAINKALDEVRGLNTGGLRGGLYRQFNENRIYLNPPNLGSNARNTSPFMDPQAFQVLEGANINPENALLEAAAQAKQIEGYNRALPGIKQAVRGGFNAVTDLTGSVPLFDPAFRQAVEQGNASKAARQIATEYVIGAASAPVVGAGMGVLQRVAPQAARVAAGGLGLARTANPVAVVSQLGGSARITPKVAAAETAQVKEQIKRAQAARARGGRWKFPTPFGALTIPELGISESGGLFFP